MYEVDLHVTPRCAGFACAALLVEILAPAPTGRVLFVNHLPQWQLDQEHERELQAAIAARCIEEHIGRRPIHVVLAGDLNATPDAASVRFWTGRQALEGTSVACRDAWASTHPDEPGHTFSPENPAVTTGEEGKWALELGRRIGLLVRARRRSWAEPARARLRADFHQPPSTASSAAITSASPQT
jgi:hypothetical protein